MSRWNDGTTNDRHAADEAITDVAGRPALSMRGGRSAQSEDGFGPKFLSTGSRSFAGCGPMNYVRSDARIFEDVCEALADDPRLDAREIEVKVTSGTAHLQGTVDSPYSARLAEHLATLCRGVTDVDNKLEVARPSSRTT